MPDPTAFLPLAQSIADGKPVDWHAVEARATGDEQGIIRQLRILSNLAALHRTLPADQTAPSPISVTRRTYASPAIGNWAHLALIERLGSGTFGEVFRAWDRHLEREVALKLLRVADSAAVSGDPRSSRIAMEGRLLARVRHGNVITVHGVEVHEGRLGLCMELIRGTTLEESLHKRGPFSAREASLIGIDLCRALAAVHSAGLVHRDVKAQNVMREDGGRIVLMDLGTGREIDSDRRDALPDLAGTPLYLAPEIFDGSQATRKTDLYSLGILLYHLVTGSFPVRATTVEELRDGHARGVAIRLRDQRPDLPTAFVRIIDRAIAIDPKRRYASAGALEADLASALDESTTATRPVPSIVASGRMAYWSIAAALALVAVGLAGSAVFRRLARPPVLLGSRDTVLVADFSNTTGESVFDGTLKEALTVQLQQSPYMNTFASANVDAGLRKMARPAGTPVSGRVARELCQREGIKAMILGSIASLGENHYLVSVTAQNCESGEDIAHGQSEASSRQGVLNALGVASAGLREKLGESLASIQRFNVPVEDATTGSLDALKAYSVGMDTRARAGDANAIAFFNHALELDPGFALAEGTLASVYANLHEFEKSQIHTKKAFELSAHVTERERLYIRGSYHLHVTGNLGEAIGAYTLWTEMYPQDWVPHNNLSAMFLRIGQFDDALKEAETARALGPDQVIPYAQLAETYMTVGRFADARAAVNLAESRGLDTPHNRALLLQLTLIEGGSVAARKEFESLNDHAKDYVIVAAAARTQAFGGDFEAARNLIAQAVAKAQSGQMGDYAASLIAEDALNAALANEFDYAKRTLDRALSLSRGSDTLWAGSLTAALSGRRALAEQLTDEYLRITPPTIDVVAVYAPVLRAANALARGDYPRAIDALQPAVPYKRLGRFWPAYIRGVAYLALKQPREAANQFEDILAHRGDAPASVLYPLARLQSGRALRAAGDLPGARAAYDAFLAAWSTARRDQPLVIAAVRERSRLAP